MGRRAGVAGLVMAIVVAACGSDGEQTGGSVAPEPDERVEIELVLDDASAADADAVAEVVERRLEALDVDASITTGPSALRVGVAPADEEAARLALRPPARLEVRPVLEVVVEVPVTPLDAVDPDADVVLESPEGERYRLGATVVDGSAIESATAGESPQGNWELWPVFTEAGMATFNAAAARCNDARPSCPTQQLAFVLDGVVLSAPSIMASDFERDQITISGEFDEQSARDLAAALAMAASPVTWTVR